MSFFSELKKKLYRGITGKSTVKSNNQRINRELQPLKRKANTRLNNRYRTGQISNTQYQSGLQNILGTKPIKNIRAPRSTMGQITLPALGEITSFATKLPSNIGSIAGTFLQDPGGSVVRSVAGSNPMNLSIKAFNAISPRDIPNPYNKPINALSDLGSRGINALTPNTIDRGRNRLGRNIEDLSNRGARGIDRIVRGSSFTPQSRPGENSVVTQLSSGAGSLASSIALARLGGTSLPATVFGVNQAGSQIRDARKAGLSPSNAIEIGVQAGTAEAGLEKVGLDKFMGRLGSKAIMSVVKNAITEGTQEALQSLAQSGISAEYKNVDWSSAVQQALVEGIYGGLLGAGATSITTISNNLENKGVPPGIATAIAKDAVNKAKSIPVGIDNKLSANYNPSALALNDDLKQLYLQRENSPPSAHPAIDRAIKLNRIEFRKVTGIGAVGKDIRAGVSKTKSNVTIRTFDTKGQPTTKEVAGKPIQIVDDVDTVIHREPKLGKEWTISEASTGLKIASGKTQKEATANAIKTIQKHPEIQDVITKAQKKFGIKDLQPLVESNTPQVSKTKTVKITDQKQTKATEQTQSEVLNPQVDPTTQTKRIKISKEAQAQDVASSQDVRNNSISSSSVSPSTDIIPDFTNEQASRPADSFNAVATNPTGKNAQVLVDSVVADQKINKAAQHARIDGKELNFFAEKAKSGRNVGIQQFNPKIHTIEGGLVLDKNGKVLGNHIKVDATGIQVNVGGKLVNIESVVGNPQDWQGNFRMMETMDRNLQRLAPDEQTYRKTRSFVIDNKTQNEAKFREDLKSERDKLGQRTKQVIDLKPRGVSKTEYKADIFDFMEGKKSDLKSKYDARTIEEINGYKKASRKLYDSLLDRVNETFIKYGEKPVPRRKDYVTHINELMNKPSFAGEMYGQLQNTMLGEGNVKTRGGVPGSIAGRTEDFKPNKRWNRFFQSRKGGEFTKDPFASVDAYLEPTLYNIHMTESAVRARAIESAFRTASELQNIDGKAVSEELNRGLDKYKNKDNGKLVKGFQEYANALTGKTGDLDRWFIDKSEGTALGLKAWQGLQRVGGRATILGNMQSVLAQTLNQPLTIADTGVINYTKGIISSLSGSTPIDKSNFITARSTNVASDFRSNFDKSMDAGGIPLQAVELAMVKNTWNAEYHKAVSEGFKGNEAVLEADRRTEQVVAGRGIADKPEAYRNTATNGLLQYTLEVSASNKKLIQDLSVPQKAGFIAATYAMNTLLASITGYSPLPDVLDALIKSFQDFMDGGDKRDTASKLIGTTQRLAGEAVSFNPLTSATLNAALPQDSRRKIFGSNSDLGRFPGDSAPIGVIRNAASAGISVSKGNLKDARNKALKIVPFGNQAKKTLTGAEALQSGFAVDKSGNPTFPVSSSSASVAKNLLFGPSSTAEAQNYYSGNRTRISGGKAELIKGMPVGEARKTVSIIQSDRQNNKSQTGIVHISGKTEKNTSGKYISRDKYDAIINAYSKKDGELSNIQKYDNQELKGAIKSVRDEFTKAFNDAGLPQIKVDSKLARDFASYKKSIDGLDDISAQKKTNNLFKNAYKSQMSKRMQSFYSLGDDEMRTRIDNGEISKAEMDKLIEVDNILTSNGLQKHAQVGKKLRRELGYGVVSGKSSGKSRKGRSKKISIKGKINTAKYLKNPTIKISKPKKVNPTVKTVTLKQYKKAQKPNVRIKV